MKRVRQELDEGLLRMPSADGSWQHGVEVVGRRWVVPRGLVSGRYWEITLLHTLVLAERQPRAKSKCCKKPAVSGVVGRPSRFADQAMLSLPEATPTSSVPDHARHLRLPWLILSCRAPQAGAEAPKVSDADSGTFKPPPPPWR